MDNREIWRNVGEIACSYGILECVGVASLQENRCAIAVMQWLRENGLAGKILRLRTKRRNEVFIICDRHSSGASITENGTHYGVEVLGKVFDNLSEEGIPREQWIGSFHCMSEKFIVDELDSL